MKKTEIRKVVLDVLKPHDPNIASFATAISKVKGVAGVNISVYEIDQRVENVKVTVEGDLENLDSLTKVIQKSGATIHSIDEVAVGGKVVSEEQTLHDRVLEQEK